MKTGNNLKSYLNVATLVFCMFLLPGCGGGGGSDSVTVNESEVSSVLISSTGSTSNISAQGEYDLTIEGTGNSLVVLKNNTINNLIISGSMNTLIIENNTTVNIFTVTGVGNTVLVPVDSGITFLDSGTGNILNTTTTNSIVGSWSYTYPSTQCIETYQFNADGTFNESSLDEMAAGTYTFSDTVITGDRHLLSIIFTSDNGMPDCNGLSEDSTGLNTDLYIDFTSAVVTEWFNESVGGSSVAVLTKQ